jgi:DNA-binding MarR family transcriptional regulator
MLNAALKRQVAAPRRPRSEHAYEMKRGELLTKPGTHAREAPALDPALDFLERLWQLNQALEQLSRRMEKRYGVTAQQRLMIRCVGRFSGIGAGQLASLLHVDPGTVSATLKRLEGKGLLRRHRDPRDKRRTALFLTARGRTLEKPLPGTVEEAVERLLEAVHTREVGALTRVAGKLAHLLGEQLRE